MSSSNHIHQGMVEALLYPILRYHIAIYIMRKLTFATESRFLGLNGRFGSKHRTFIVISMDCIISVQMLNNIEVGSHPKPQCSRCKAWLILFAFSDRLFIGFLSLLFKKIKTTLTYNRVKAWPKNLKELIAEPPYSILKWHSFSHDVPRTYSRESIEKSSGCVGCKKI